ncbi:MAG TPA: HAMP domain-containing sensor histidine kinase [Acidimicrobiales bacterium]|nr:HAMP domain-containing sensor histidine kinase [Acidimicrobiales bacterium]
MTFRTRVIAATVLAAAIAVVLGGLASYLSTRHALLNAVDASLRQDAQAQHDADDPYRAIGSFTEVVLPSGQTLPKSDVPIDKTIMAIAKGQMGEQLRTVNFDKGTFRELIAPLPAGSYVTCPTGVCQISTTSAEVFVVDITGQIEQLHELFTTLLLVAAGGLLVAFGLGLFLARQALHPLEEVTNEIESVSLTNDLEHRLDEGDDDELGRLRRVFNELLRSVESSQSLQRQLVVDASHELRTPLTSLRTNAQVLARRPDLSSEEMAQLTTDMITQVDELTALVGDLAELARGERSEGDVRTLRLDDCVDECVETARTYARPHDLTVDVESEPSFVVGRQDRLVRAVSNLLTNAVKFTPEGGRIVVRTREGWVSVSDSGPGVAPGEVPYVFDRFWRSPSARGLPGSGLGLSIVAQVVDELHGTVEVDRDPELGGARFTIRLPEVDAADAER